MNIIIRGKMAYSTVNRRPWLLCQMYITNGVNQISNALQSFLQATENWAQGWS